VLIALVGLVALAVTGMERVEELEGVLEIDAVRVLGWLDVRHAVTTLYHLTGYAQVGTVCM
jgi:hypothetical protein